MNVGDDDRDQDVDDTFARRGRPAGFVSSTSLSAHTLPEGSRLLDYEITGVVGEGGFGIVYLAWDPQLERRIAIKEYLPSSMASRAAASATVVLKSERHADTFRAGLKSFVNEARLLARFSHPALVRVYRFWEQNGTAYMMMPYYEGPTLKQVLALRREPPSEAELRAWLRPLLDALSVMHAAHCFHRDIAPDNILLTPTGPLLLDFGAARRVIGDMTHALTVVLKPGFAPIEQYGEVASMAQGAWTDLYALASVVHAALTGKPPMSSVERLMDDRLVPLARLAEGRYSAPFLHAIDAALALRPADRPQDVAAFRALLDGGPADKPPGREPAQRGAEAAAPVSLAAPMPAVQALVTRVQAEGTDSGRAASAARQPMGGRRRLPGGAAILLMAAAVVAVPGAASYWLISGRGAASTGAAAAPPTPATTKPASTDTPAGPPTAVSASAAIAMPMPMPMPPTAQAPSPASAAERAAPQTLFPTPATASTRRRDAADSPTSPPPSVAAPISPAPVTAAAGGARETTPNPGPAGDVGRAAAAAQHSPRQATLSPPRPRRDPQPAPETAAPAPNVTEDTSARASSRTKCSDILQKASLEALTAEEAAYLKRECR